MRPSPPRRERETRLLEEDGFLVAVTRRTGHHVIPRLHCWTRHCGPARPFGPAWQSAERRFAAPGSCRCCVREANGMRLLRRFNRAPRGRCAAPRKDPPRSSVTEGIRHHAICAKSPTRPSPLLHHSTFDIQYSMFSVWYVLTDPPFPPSAWIPRWPRRSSRDAARPRRRPRDSCRSDSNPRSDGWSP